MAELYTQGMNESELVKVLYRIPKEHRKELNIRAAEQDTTATELVRKLIRQYLAEQHA